MIPQAGTRIYRDNRGAEIKIGSTVIYNYGGDMGYGTVIKLPNTPPKGGVFTIERQYPGGNNTLSKVKSAGAIMVVNEAPPSDVLIANGVATINAALEILLDTIAGAWDLDEVKLKLEAHLGPNWMNGDYKLKDLVKLVDA